MRIIAIHHRTGTHFCTVRVPHCEDEDFVAGPCVMFDEINLVLIVPHRPRQDQRRPTGGGKIKQHCIQRDSIGDFVCLLISDNRAGAVPLVNVIAHRSNHIITLDTPSHPVVQDCKVTSICVFVIHPEGRAGITRLQS